MKLEDYEKLPDFLPVHDVENMFRDVLANKEQLSRMELIKILFELTSRQADTLVLLEQKIKSEVDNVVCGLWEIHSLEEVELLTSIILNLGLGKCFELMKQSLSESMSEPIRQEIEDTIEEAGNHILNPLHSWEKYK